jgi:hypothetical protein
MRPIGFSTGAIALGDFGRALRMVRDLRLTVVELSALREHELDPLIAALDTLDLGRFEYVSVHAPSRLETWDEWHLIARLHRIIERGYPIVVHPDVIGDPYLWAGFGDLLCIENMDKRKPVGRTASELADVFNTLPASLCFDIGHARQVDPTMSHAMEILDRFGSRLRQVHVSEVNASSTHEPLNRAAQRAFLKVSHLIPEHIPIILETPVSEEKLIREIEDARVALAGDWVPVP